MREPISDVVTELLRHLRITPRWACGPAFDAARLPVLERATAERYLAVLVQRELAYGIERLPRASAQAAAAAFLRPFGPLARFYASITLSADVLEAKEQNRPCGYGVLTGIFGSTLEEGVLVIDPAGCIGLLVVGDED